MMLNFFTFSTLFSQLSFKTEPKDKPSDKTLSPFIMEKLKIDEEDKYLLCEADSLRSEAIVWMQDAQKFSNDLKEILLIVDASENYNDLRNKAIKKAQRTEQKIIQRQTDALEYFEISNDIIYTFYKKYHQRIFPDVDNKSIIEGNLLIKEAEKIWKEAKILREKGYYSDINKQSVDILIRALEKEEEAILTQEKAFGIFTNTEWNYTKTIDSDILCYKKLPKKQLSNIEQTNNEMANNSYPISTDNNETKTEKTTANNINKDIPNLNYKIQVGAFLGNPNEAAFKGIQPVSVEKSESGFKRYLAGNYKSQEAAIRALEILHNTGFNDAFIVAYSNDIRIGPGIKINESNETANK